MAAPTYGALTPDHRQVSIIRHSSAGRPRHVAGSCGGTHVLVSSTRGRSVAVTQDPSLLPATRPTRPVLRRRRRSFPRRSLLLLTAIAACALAAGVSGTRSALACDTGFWRVGCQYYSSNESHTTSNQNSNSFEYVYTTFSPTDGAIHAILTRSGGGWVDTQALLYGQCMGWLGIPSGYRAGCWNSNTSTYWVNCRAGDSCT